MEKIYFYSSRSRNGKEMIEATGRDFETCELKAMQKNYDIYGEYKLPGGYDSTGNEPKGLNNIIKTHGVSYIKKEIREHYKAKNSLINAIIESESY